MEILSPSILKKYNEEIEEVDLMCKRLASEVGWHYILDLVWILKEIDLEPGATILDAGAGNGILQFILSERGYNVISVDFSSRRIPLLAPLAFPIKDIGGQKYRHEYISHLKNQGLNITELQDLKVNFLKLFYKLKKIGVMALGFPFFSLSYFAGLRKPGIISYFCLDMSKMEPLANSSVDAVVSLSAIEHMEPATIGNAVQEFKRVLKPKGKIIITTSAAEEKDWFHKPSKGWCFGEESIKKLFDFDSETLSNWNLYRELMKQFSESEELKKRIPFCYKLSGENGMPWGIWDPKYLPVGIVCN